LFDDQFKFNTGIACENTGGVNLCKFELPVLDDDDLGFQVSDVDVGVFGFEVLNRFLGEIAWDVEVVVSDKEVWETFFDVAFDLVVHLSLDSSDISTVFENFGVK